MSKLEIKNLGFSYTAKETILEHIDLTILEESVAIIGQNGAGKTTFVKLLKGLLKPTQGEIYLDGEEIGQKTVAQLARKIGMVFQNPNDQIFKNSVMEEVKFGPIQIGMDVSSSQKNAEEALRLVGLLEKSQENPYDLGLSDRKLISIASILAMDTEIVIFDEPTIAQDYAGKEKIKSIIYKLRSEGKTVITIIHDMDFVAETFERTIVFAKGKVKLDGKTEQVFLAQQILKDSYLEQPHVIKLCNSLGMKENFLTAEELIAWYQR